jgi:succinyl-CoA synthetase beta subunit
MRDRNSPHQLIEGALARGQRALSEYESKLLLAAYGLPVTREALARSPSEASRLAVEIGLPVAVKGCSPDLPHKTEAGVIDLAVGSRAAVKRSCRRIAAAAPVALEGLLIQEMVRGTRELALGLIRDPQFGPCVMFGLGGILTEVLDDTVFRVAPFDRPEAEEMIGDIRARTILGPFRGEPPVDTDLLCGGLLALARIGCQHPQVAEIDVNPLIVRPDGRVTAVDALVVLAAQNGC